MGRAESWVDAWDFGVGDRVTFVADGPFHNCEGLVVKRDENRDGEPVWTVDFEGAGMNVCLTHELERV
jgi:transcription antitermination factor NusG